MSRIRRILHATDFSRASAAAFAKAVELAESNSAELVVLHVLAPAWPLTGEGYVSPKIYQEIAAAGRAHSQKQLNALLARAKKAGVRAKGLLVDGSAPHERIARAARSQQVDLLVIGTHGRTGLSKLFLGSVAGRVVSIAPCPVLTVRGKRGKA